MGARKRTATNPILKNFMSILRECRPGSILQIRFWDDPATAYYVKVEQVEDQGDQIVLDVFTHYHGATLRGRTITIAPRWNWFFYTVPRWDAWKIVEHIRRRPIRSIEHLYCPAL